MMRTLQTDWRQAPALARRGNLSTRTFMREFGKPGVPVVLEGLSKHWEANRLWTRAFFTANFGHELVTVFRQAPQAPAKRLRLSAYLRYMYSTRDTDPYYLKSWSAPQVARKVRSHYEVPEYLKNWIEQLDKTQKLYFPSWSWFFIGPAKAGSALHVDTDFSSAWNAVVSGSKLWLFYEPSQERFLYRGQVDTLRPDLKKYPHFAKARLHGYCIQRPGDVVFTPSEWWHQVVNLEACISITENFINASNDRLIVRGLARSGDFDRAKAFAHLSDEARRTHAQR